MNKPYIVEFPVKGSEPDGFLSFAEAGNHIPFSVKRVYWIYEAEEGSLRGDHAHKKGNQVLVAFGGDVDVELVSPKGEEFHFTLSRPDIGLFVPGKFWRKVIMAEKSILISFASEAYDPENYINDFDEFINAS